MRSFLFRNSSFFLQELNITSQIAQALFDTDQHLTPNTAIWQRVALM
jgi:hypothetical protein